MDDGRKGLPYAPYLIFMIERVTGYKFDKDGLHTVYKIEKTQSSGASKAVRCSPSVEDVPESSRSRSRKGKKMEKFGNGSRPFSSLAPMHQGPHMRTGWRTVKPTERLESE